MRASWRDGAEHVPNAALGLCSPRLGPTGCSKTRQATHLSFSVKLQFLSFSHQFVLSFRRSLRALQRFLRSFRSALFRLVSLPFLSFLFACRPNQHHVFQSKQPTFGCASFSSWSSSISLRSRPLATKTNGSQHDQGDTLKAGTNAQC